MLISQDWALANQEMVAHQAVISLKPMIDKALELQKIEQQNKADKKNLSNRASSLADKVFPAVIQKNGHNEHVILPQVLILLMGR